MTKQTKRKITTFFRRLIVSDKNWVKRHKVYRQSFRLIPVNAGGKRVGTIWVEE